MKKFLLFLLLLLSACNILGPGSGRQSEQIIYRTPQIDFAHGATVLPNGDFVVYGFTEGVGGAAEWTNAFPFLLFMHSDGTIADTVVYRDIRYGEVIGAAPFGNEVAVLVDSVLRVGGPEPNELKISLLEADHSLGDVIYSLADSMRHLFAPANPLVPTPDNGLVFAFYPIHRADDGLIKINAAGEIVWTYDSVGSVDVAEDGDILVLSNRNRDQFDVARLNAAGQVQWQKTYGDPEVGGRVFAIAAVQDGAAVLGRRFVSPGVNFMVLTRIDKNGELLWQQTYGEGERLTGTLTALADGGLVFGWSKSFDGEQAEIVRLSTSGKVMWHHRFGPAQGTTRISRILALPNGRIAVVGVAGPEYIEGYGADDFDILIMLLDD